MGLNTNTTNVPPSSSGEISLKDMILKVKEWYSYLLSNWKVILLMGIIGGSLGFTYVYFKKPTYTASCTFVLDEGKTGGGLGQYAGLAAIAGISIGGGANDGLFQGDNLLELYKSRRMLQKTLLSYGTFDGRRDLLINRYIQINRMREVWAKRPSLKGLRFDIPPEKFSRAHDSIVRSIVSDINRSYLTVAKPDKKLSIIKVDVRSDDEQFAKNFNDAVVVNVNGFYIETKTKKQQGTIQILRRQADSVRAVLNTSIGGTASSIDANPNPNMAMQMLRVPSQRKQIDVQANTAIYAEVVKSLEMTKISALQDAPLIQVIDNAVYPLEKASFGKLKGAVIGGALLGFLTACFLLMRYFLKSL
ncbi:subunit length determinant protein [Arcticibacter pallidicorallinus]|uniref:Subunit length determinant protein n=1 Tax=Arcticibacter pallidicorallinus TaxID=1259464 RepID=A0A2T0U6Y2_9SPHI|nr:lipopolysaccharide biosynthesis protein [Arcticibacter pallidicorallinus]PRY53676.1 subunit length determinant protein [Arcticibacter pallidicorallinus]